MQESNTNGVFTSAVLGENRTSCQTTGSPLFSIKLRSRQFLNDVWDVVDHAKDRA